MKDDRVYLGHILEAIDRVLAYSKDGEGTFRREAKTQDAIIRNLQVMGEAVKKVSAETRAAHPDISLPTKRTELLSSSLEPTST